MRYRIIGLVLSTIGVAAYGFAQAQQTGKVPLIGLLVPGSRAAYARRIDSFRQGLRELGYVEGKNIIIEYRYAEGRMNTLGNTLAELADELVRLKVAVIVTSSFGSIQAAKNKTKTIPIVFTAAADPVEDGLVSSLARPGGNVTGLALLAPELNGKRIELLKEAFPKITRVAFLWRPGARLGDRRFRDAEGVAKTLGLRLQSVAVKGADAFDGAVEAAKLAGAQALTASPDPVLTTHRARIIDLAAKKRLPAMYVSSEWVDDGGLMSYGPDSLDNWRHAASYIDKILKGRNPADLPVEQPMKFEFVINLKTAKQIDATIPPNLLVRAQRVIR
jgi:putative ABC transport system substrate-binding protein